MPILERLNIGIVGAAGRGASFRAAFDAHPSARIHAVCDTQADALPEAAKRLGASEQYTDYESMLTQSELDAVVIGTPMPDHVPQAIKALEENVHVLSEVTAAVSVDECQALVKTASTSNALYMMAENYTYMKPNVMIKALVQQGLFGEVYYAEGEYLHELKDLNERTPWRRRWQTGIDGITYGTHSLGPILQWMPDDRVVQVCCQGSGHRYRDPGGDLYENQATCVMLAKTDRGALIKIRVDMLSERPHAMANYVLQGTKGSYESARSPAEPDRIWLADLLATRTPGSIWPTWKPTICLRFGATRHRRRYSPDTAAATILRSSNSSTASPAKWPVPLASTRPWT
ncbi:MAG: Gfo/Idh/MocA family oxidoreductase [Pseudomonadales bacterium]|jgi:predicted dehydrogenase|nr:Gfo/Idh/MocA family oxidoreductase [Pseudomonadales bacterium]MDP7596023.1 Gfo/Idh/MocA family oxidoreductase [Pseudomonadales bacterium]HJN53022.1 Gfo/Idh/MocA family oxidoreductase [Pseudomonadales bacterium]